MRSFAPGIAGIWIAVAALAQAAEPTELFRKEVTFSGKGDESLVAVKLDAEVYSSSQSGYADLRLRDARGTTIPFLVQKSQEVRLQTVRRRAWTSSKPTLKPLESGGLEITLKLDEQDPSPNGIRLVTPLRNFEQRARVLTSSDGQTWEPASADTVIFDYSRFMDVRNDNVTFPSTSRKHFRIVIDDVTLEQQSELLELTRRLRGNDETERTERVSIDRRPFRIDQIQFWQDGTEEHAKSDHKQNYPIVGFKVSEDIKVQQTIVEIETHREPLTSFVLETSSKNFSRNAVLQIPEQHGVQKSWRDVSSTTISRLDFQTLKREQLRIEFPESRENRYRLVIDNRDSSPLAITEVTTEGNVYEIIFLAGSNQPNELTYGDSEATAPNYDTESLRALLTENVRPDIGQLGLEVKIVGAASTGFKWSSIVNDPRILTGVIGVLVVVLGWALYGAVKRIDASPPEPPAP
ncbi:MAG TPA: DUF3999 family protein [Schlesneria sp.]|jgi:hypothetical protein